MILRGFLSLGAILLALTPFCSAEAAPSATQTCSKMISAGRSAGMGQSDCLCWIRVADVVLDDDIKALLFDSWADGTNNVEAMLDLPDQKRVKKQLETLVRTLKKNCRTE